MRSWNVNEVLRNLKATNFCLKHTSQDVCSKDVRTLISSGLEIAFVSLPDMVSGTIRRTDTDKVIVQLDKRTIVIQN